MTWQLVPIGDGSVSVAVEVDDHPGDVHLSLVTRSGERALDPAVLTTPAAPSETDPPETVAPEIGVRLLQAHASDHHSVKDHAA